MRTKLTTLVIAAAAASQMGATDCGQALRDSGFDLWCGSALCAWTVEHGSIAKVPTWNAGDFGVELDGSATAISQLSPVTSTDTTCLEFDLIANIDDDAEVDLNVDLDGDGSIEYSQRIPTSKWQSLSFKLPTQGIYTGIRFELAKSGNGSAVLAQIEAQASQDCGALPPIIAGPGPLGAACGSNGDCTSGTCETSASNAAYAPGLDACVGCVAGGCGSGMVCGFGAPTLSVDNVPIECVTASAKQLGEQCVIDGECASGTCTGGMCSTCSTGSCTGGETCAPAWTVTPAEYATPYVCNPNGHARTAGEPCASDDDCASSTCNGAPRMQCDDGRACTTAADCPFGTMDTSNGLQNGPCNVVGVQGGSCN